MDDLKSKSMIELAMDKAAQDAAHTQPDSLVLRQRKSDWRAAPEPSQSEPASPSPLQLDSSIGEPPDCSHATDQPAPRFGLRAMLVAVTFSAWTGAGLMWLLMQPGPPGSQPVASANLPELTPQTAAAPAAVSAKASQAADDGISQARYLLERWRQAWETRDIPAYLSCYSPAFVPAHGQSHAAWESARRKKLSSHSDIRVHIGELSFERIGDDSIRLSFMQDYASGAYREHDRPKILMLTRSGGVWKIVAEWQPPPAKQAR